MNSAQITIQIIVTLVAIACAIPGTFLVLRKMSLISDAISHSILLGIVIGFFIVEDTSSPLLIFLAALAGVVTVILVEFIQKTGLVKEDTAIGLVFPALFSIGVILISKNANDVHLDIDSVMVGDLSLAPFDPLLINCQEGIADSCVNLGPKAIWVVGIILIITLTLLFAFFKELKVSTFDAGLAAALGFSPVIMHYGLMTVSSITIVGAFDAVGPILVVALMIAPAATAYLFTKDLKKMLLLSCFFGVIASIAGFWLAYIIDASISGSMTTVLAVLFLLVYEPIITSVVVSFLTGVGIIFYQWYTFLMAQGIELDKMLLGKKIQTVFSEFIFLDYFYIFVMTSIFSATLIYILPKRGLIYGYYKVRQQKTEIMLLVFLLHIRNHTEESERHVKHLNEHINWQRLRSQSIVALAEKNNMITVTDQIISLTEKGDDFTEKAIDYIITNKDTEIEEMKDDFFLFRG
ncbi:manganese transport system membrane protein MntB [Kordia sp. SMS9]|uniref:metal ABC transporter permease n=1 Tax=Kordia sp. SMS9 TaxID=2282170 RepID=UPI000E10B96B|nr:metal ABC transporter permease [Kordia sp. SMS9]AXG69180.1 manganese transport system membrane protein MntB [Kordia sp. SMS9]